MQEQNASRDVCRAAIRISLSEDRDAERKLKEQLRQEGILSVAVDFGGEYITSVVKMVERAVVASRREGLIGEHHNEQGAVAGAAHEAISQISTKAIGLNVGGKIGIARMDDHIAVAVFAGIGLLHLNENAVGLSHRAI